MIVDVRMPLTDDSEFECALPILVVPDTKHNRELPMLVGMNILTRVPVDKASMTSIMPPIKAAISAIHAQQKLLDENNGIVGRITVNSDTLIESFSTTVVQGLPQITVPIQQQVVLVEGIEENKQIIPGIVNVSNKSEVNVEVVNDSEKPMKLKKGDIIAHMFKVTITSEKQSNVIDSEFLEFQL